MSYRQNLDIVKNNIENACKTSCLSPKDVKIIAVTKTRTIEQINEIIDLGITDIGENRVQELIEKYGKTEKKVNWHLIGTLQKNKVKYIADKVTMIHSVESLSLAQEINKQCAKINKVMDILVQVNVSGEETKSGIEPGYAHEFVQQISNFNNIKVRGLMTMAPLSASGEEISKIFTQLKQLSVDIATKKYDNINMDYLSMGMSNDYEIAVRCGSNIVRIGSALFR